MQLLVQYLERAELFERLAADESNTALKADLLRQSEAHRTLLAKRARDLNLELPPAESR